MKRTSKSKACGNTSIEPSILKAIPWTSCSVLSGMPKPPNAFSRKCSNQIIIVEQDHRFIKRRIKPGLGFSSFNTARRTLRGYEAMNMIRKGQVKDIDKGDVIGQLSFIHELFGVAG